MAKDSTTIIVAGLGIGAAYLLLKRLIPDLGKAADDLLKDPAADVNLVNRELEKGASSPWNPTFWYKAPQGTPLISNKDVDQMTTDLVNSVGGWLSSDNFPKAFAVIKRLKTQTQVSYLADWFQRHKSADLLAWLRGDWYPDDHFSDQELAQMIRYVNKLPKY